MYGGEKPFHVTNQSETIKTTRVQKKNKIINCNKYMRCPFYPIYTTPNQPSKLKTIYNQPIFPQDPTLDQRIRYLVLFSIKILYREIKIHQHPTSIDPKNFNDTKLYTFFDKI